MTPTRLLALIALVPACYAGSVAETPDASTGDATTSQSSSTSTGPDDPATTGSTTATTGSASDDEPDLGALGYTADDAREYLASIAPMVVGRLLSPDEDNLIHHFGADAIVPIVEAWVSEPAFADTARAMLQVKLAASGSKDGVDFELPGNLAAHLARNDRPYGELLTAPYCVDPVGAEIPCDTGAPYAAGVLTTRAYLIANASRFNLRRARRMMFIFTCSTYPMDPAVQPRIAKDTLIPMFRAMTKEEQTVPEAANGFGNGSACYSCHGQFSAHAQLFVRFSQDGLYHPEATGLQDPDNELGRSINGLYASHFVDPAAAPLEVSQVLNQLVDTLVDAGRVLSESPAFYPCAARNVLEYSFGMSEAEAVDIDPKLLAELTTRAHARDLRLRADAAAGPTFGDLFVVALTHPRVLQVVIGLPESKP
ncbi:hypothetical protein [Nannocystis sp.]|uniref:hypothetical protein n=1 Tax=Nannocystis sp. TaxID=1962667 RepID=UPI0025D14BAD|nr:hypothetical protein [Nannocystis sp.]MBK7829013.1 hypothetical protein [Nannocystis sp.]